MSGTHVVPLDSSRALHHGLITNLELTSNVTQFECQTFLEKWLGPLGKKFHWTDYECCLKQIKDLTTCFPEFTANRLSKIHEVSVPEEWRHVPSAQNTADMCARGIRANKWRKFHRGADFLHQPESEWPLIKDYFRPKPFPTATVAAVIVQPEVVPDVPLYDVLLKESG